MENGSEGMLHKCPECDYGTGRKYNLARHMKMVHGVDTATMSLALSTVTQECERVIEQDDQGRWKCPTCYKTFSKERGVREHRSNCQRLQHPLECCGCHRIFGKSSSKARHMKICAMIPDNEAVLVNHIDGNNQFIQNNIQNQNNIQTQNNFTTNNVINIHIQPFGNERVDYITNEFKDMCIRAINGVGVKMMVEKTHFNDEVPENQNVRLHSSKHQQVDVFDGERWEIKDKDEVVDRMVMNTCAKLLKHYHESPIRDEDMNEHHNVLIQNLMAIGQRMPTLYHPVKRQLFAMVCDLSRKLATDNDNIL